MKFADYTDSMSTIRNLENMLARGQDNAALRLALANAYMRENRLGNALDHLRAALRSDPGYSAAWKAFGKALEASGDKEQARQAYREGMAAAEANGDVQAAKEMRVFLRRLDDKSP